VSKAPPTPETPLPSGFEQVVAPAAPPAKTDSSAPLEGDAALTTLMC
jgi:hypothetical protein